MVVNAEALFNDPVKLVSVVWPDLKLYDKQAEIMRSVWDNDETYVPAGNMLGKDWIAGLIALCFFISRSPCRVVTTSVDASQLEGVLWGEIRNFVRMAAVPLPIEVNHLHIYQTINGQREAKSEIIGRVAKKGEGLLGRHLPSDKARTLVIFDEASGIEDIAYNSVDTWAHKKLIIGNCYPCTNFFRRAVKQGDVLAPCGTRYYQKIIRIKAEDSPNVKTRDSLLPGVLTYPIYEKRRNTWDPIRQCIGLDADWYEGAENLLYPPEWLNLAESRAEQIRRERLREDDRKPRRVIGCDPGEGSANTSWSIVDSLGLIRLVSKKTQDTTEVTRYTKAIIKEYDVDPQDVFIDRGGGGKQHVDSLRQDGYRVNSVGFGEAASEPRILPTKTAKKQEEETRYAYKNRRAQMYGELRFELLDPSSNSSSFGIPAEYVELRRQLSMLPLLYDKEGRIYLPPKNKVGKSTEETITDILGCSPDEADSFVLATYGLLHPKKARVLGAF